MRVVKGSLCYKCASCICYEAFYEEGIKEAVFSGVCRLKLTHTPCNFHCKYFEEISRQWEFERSRRLSQVEETYSL